LDKLQEWQTKYAATEFEKQRKQLFLVTYVALNQPKEAVGEAKLILADDPKDFTSLYYTMYFTRALAGNNPTPDVLDQGEKATTALLANIDTPPPNVTADQWKGARTPVEILGHSTLGWIAMQRKMWDAAEGEFQKTLAMDPNNAEVDYFLGTVIASEKNPQKMPVAIFYFTRAATYDGPTGALPQAGRQQVMDYVKRAYKGYHGSDEGFNDVLTLAKAQAVPPPDYHIRTAKEIAEENQKKQEAEDAKDPQLKLWKDIKTQLTGADGASYFSTNMKDALLPPLKGKVVKLEPEMKPKTVVLALEDGTTPDATLKFEMPLAGKVDPGTELTFEGVPASYTASPYMVVFNVEPDKLHGWTGKNAPRPAPVHKKASASN
jgi:tetratricopeptide (TPR) repeat protein